VVNYIIRRILFLIPTIFLVTIINFLLVRWVPGSAVDVIESSLSQGGTVNIDRQAIIHMLGLDVPVHIQYIRWVSAIILHGDFGNSIIQGRPVLRMILERMPVTIELGIIATIIGWAITLPFGVWTAVKQDSVMDYSMRFISIIMMAMPPFWIMTMIMIYPSVWWGWSPPVELIPFTKDPLGNLGMFIIPGLLMGIMQLGMGLRMIRMMMLECMRQDYIRTAWAKGLRERTVIVRHVIKNAFIPVITALGGTIGMIFGGSVFAEQIFCLPGMGLLTLQSLNQRDYPLIAAITLLLSFIVMFSNLLVDISYTWLDPRVRYE
jgi:peptide/nickel transport system permease protein